MKKITAQQFLKFFIPSLIGVSTMLIPVEYNGTWTLLYAVICGMFDTLLAPVINYMLLIIFTVSFVLAVFTKAVKPQFVMKNSILKGVFDVKPFIILMRALGLATLIAVQFKIGPAFMFDPNTGETAYGLIKTICVWMFIATFLIIFLMDFGAMDLVGILLKKIMRPLFTVPGRASLDCAASFVGSGTSGVILTTMQYDDGYYTNREACVIATCFSTCSLGFAYVMCVVANIGDYFVPLYLIMLAVIIVCAIILPRIYPLRNKKDEYCEGVEKQITEDDIPDGVNKFKLGLEQAIDRASKVTSVKMYMDKCMNTIANVWFDMLPTVLVVATLGLVVSTYTPFFEIISMPLVPVLNLLGIAEAQAVAPTMISGFADQFIPIAVAAGMESAKTRFFVVCVAISQIFYMSELGAIILRSKMKFSILDMLVVFIERTIIAVPVVLLLMNFVKF